MVATDLIIRKKTNIDFSTILKFLTQWTENNRKVNRSRRCVRMEGREEELTRLLSALDTQLVRAVVTEDGKGKSYCFSLEIQRLSDGARLEFLRNYEDIQMRLF